jgi:hypothetical protein
MSHKRGSQGPTGINRRRFIKSAAAGTFVAPTLVSFAADHMRNRAYAQQSYIPQLVSVQSVGTESGGITLVHATFNLPMRPDAVCGTVQDWGSLNCTGSIITTSYLSQSVDWPSRWSAGNTVLLLRLAPSFPVANGMLVFNDPSGCTSSGAPRLMQSAAGVELPLSQGCFLYLSGGVPRSLAAGSADNR